MKKTLLYGSILAFLWVCYMAEVVMADNFGPQEIRWETRKTATFPHALHQNLYSCGICHHSMDEYGNKIDYVEEDPIKCELCHNKYTDMPRKLDSFIEVAHILCRGCHKESNDKELTKCVTCHPK